MPADVVTAAQGDWQWDPTLYAGSAPHYGSGRMPYPGELSGVIRDALGLDGTGRLLDVGCGPGSLTLLLAPFVATAVGVDADPDMIVAARRGPPPTVPSATWSGAACGPRSCPPTWASSAW
jgi:trans-aconitate methyltransferase